VHKSSPWSYYQEVRLVLRGHNAFALFAVIAGVLVLVVASSAAAAPPVVETWSGVSGDPFYAGDGLCGSGTVAGTLVDGSGLARITETQNGGAIVRGYSDDTWRLYEASGPPWDVTFGAFFATMTVHVPFQELTMQNGQSVQGSVATGRLVYADGSSQAVKIVFRLVLSADGPPSIFLVHFACGG
jgi:hypothetical protein